MKLVECILINDCLAQKRVGNSVKKKPFRTDSRVVGVVTNVALTPDSQVLALKTQDGYIIPEPFLNVIGEVKGGSRQQKANKETQYEDIEDAEIIEDEKEEKSIVNVFESLKASNIVTNNSLKSKRVVNFALGGAAIGLVYAMLKRKNKLIVSTLGAITGGIVGNYVSSKIKENDKK